jgi:hypothetical protein
MNVVLEPFVQIQTNNVAPNSNGQQVNAFPNGASDLQQNVRQVDAIQNSSSQEIQEANPSK